MNSRFFLIAGSLLAGLAVAAGAFGAHALAATVPPARLQTFETAARYQMYHALAVLFVGFALQRESCRHIATAGYLFLAGIVVFSGSLYLLVLTDTAWLGAITPLGGVCFLAGWGLMVLSAWKRRA